jgi:3-keto-disaccharide hydrolase
MKSKLLLFSFISSVFVAIILFTSFSFDEEGWTSLLDKNLSRWEIYQSYKYTTDYNGEVPKDEKGDSIQPIGFNKNVDNVFSVSEENDEPVLRVSGEIYGSLFTKDEYENFDLKLKVKWGNKKWEPRINKLRDTGLMYNSIGECGVDYWRTWMRSQEFQIMEGHMGDYWSTANAAIDIRAFLSEGTMNSVASERQPFISFDPVSNLPGFCLRSADYESPKGEWTELELISFEDKSIRLVNGHVVMVLQNSRYKDEDKIIPLTKGKLQLQSESAEVYFKDIIIKSLNELPQEYVSYFK